MGSPTKLDAVKRIAASIGYMALAESERTQVLTASIGLDRTFEPSRGRASVPKLLRELDAISEAGGTNLARAIDAVIARSARPGALVVFSDFFDPGDFDTAIARAAAAGHEITLVQVLTADEVDPPYDGDFAFEDSETLSVVEVTVDGHALEAYHARLDALITMLRGLAKRHRATYVRTLASDPVLPTVRRCVARTID